MLSLYVKYRYIEFFAFDYDSLPYFLSVGDCRFPLVALDKITIVINTTIKITERLAS